MPNRNHPNRSKAWRKIAEWAPASGDHVIGWNKQWGVAEFMHNDDGWAISSFNGSTYRSRPSHWQPMPKPPLTTEAPCPVP